MSLVSIICYDFISRITCLDSFALFKINLSVSGSNVSAKDRGSWSRSWNARTFGNFIEEIIFWRRSLAGRWCQIQLSIMNSSFTLHWSWPREKRRGGRFGWQGSGTLSDSQRYECRRTRVPIDSLEFSSYRVFAQTDQRRGRRPAVCVGRLLARQRFRILAILAVFSRNRHHLSSRDVRQ